MRLAFLTLFTALFGFSSFAQNASPSIGCAPYEVNFSPPDGGQAFWNFGDGASSPLSSPSHVYTTPGTYDVTFSRTDGGPVIGTVEVQVFPKPDITLVIDDTEGCIPHTAQFDVTTNLDAAITINEINWAFGDGSSGNGASTSNTYQQAGDYDVSVELVTSLSTCNTTVIFSDTIIANPLPNVRFTTSPNPPQSCDIPLIVQLTNRSTGADPLAHAWDFGNGTTSADEEPGAITYGVAGSYPLSLTVTDDNGCENTSSRTVSAGPPSANFNLPDTVCFGQTYPVSALGAADTYDWTFGPNITLLEDLNSTQVIAFTLAGNTTISLAVENLTGGCSADTIRTLFVQQVVPDVTSDPAVSCESPFTINYRVNNPNVTARWVFPQGVGASTALDTSITYVYDEGGEYGQNWFERVNARLTITSEQGCFTTITVTDGIDVPNALFIPDVHNGCAPLTVNFADSIRSNPAVTSVTIDWGDGTVETVSNMGAWSHTYTAPGEYNPFLWMENASGCRDTSYSIPIQVGELIGNLSYTSDATPACPGDTLTFINTTADPRIDNVHFEVEGGTSFHCADNDTLFHVLTNTIEGNAIDLTLYVDYNGCIDSLTEAITYASAPRAELGYLIECETPYDVRFYNRNTRSTADSLYVFYTDSVGVYRDSFALADSLDLTLPNRGVYEAVIVAIDPASPCGSNRDTVEFYITEPIAEFSLDTLFCSGAVLPLDGSASQDVNATCAKGYQWEFTWDRPYTSSRSSTGMDVQTGARGDQTVFLIVEDINGCTDTTSNDIRVFQTNLAITASESRICLPATVDFSLAVDTDTTVVSYMWDFGGYGTSTQQNPTFSFPNDPDAGNEITVTVMTMDELGCPGSADFIISVYRPFSEVLTIPEAPIICAGNTINFAASDFTAEGSNLQFMWDFGNGFTSQNRIEDVTYNTQGNFNVTLDYTEVATGCSADTTILVQVQVPPTPDFTSDIDGQAVVCFPQIITFSDNSSSASPYTPIWQVGTQLSVGNEFTASLDRGTSDVSLITITSAGCADTLTRQFTLVGPEGGFTFEPGVICVGETVEFMLRDTVDVESWTWDFGNGTTEENTNPTSSTYDFRPADGRTLVSLTLESAGGECTFTVTDTLRFLDIVADFTTDLGSDFACDPTVMFFDQSMGATSYLYDFGTGDTSTDPSPTYTFPRADTTFSVTLQIGTNEAGCRDSITRSITVLGPLDLSLELPTLCVGDDGIITVNTSRPLSSVVFDPTDLIVSQSGNQFRTRPLTTDENLTVSVIDTFGCEGTLAGEVLNVGATYSGSSEDTIQVFIFENETGMLEPEPSLDGFQFQWSDGLTGEAPTVPAPDEDGQFYELTVFGCEDVTIVFQVLLVQEPVVPNLFSPNGDGTNDTWGPLFPEEVLPTVEIYQVYNRWGALVFESGDPNERWIGDKNGSGECPSDVYAYVIKFSYPNGSEFNSAGEITLLR